MKKLLYNNEFFLILAVILACVCIAAAFWLGDECVLECNTEWMSLKDENYSIIIDEEGIVEVTDSWMKGKIVYLKMKAIGPGKSYVGIQGSDPNEGTNGNLVYVHNNGMITIEKFFGYYTGSQLIPICIAVWLAFMLARLILKYRESTRENLCRYRNISTLGLIIFVAFTVIWLLFVIYQKGGIYGTVRNIMGAAGGFANFTLPVAFVLSILIAISNINLLRKEGRSLKNVLGTAFGITIFLMTIAPIILGEILQRSSVIDVHYEKSVWIYVEIFVENCIYTVVAFLECMLIATIIIALKAARRTPSFDKDYVIIQGSLMNPDGTLTKLLQGRVDRAIEFAKLQKEKSGRDIIFVPSGGKGGDEPISEGEAMERYLLEQGIDPEHILVEDKSSNTWENIEFSMKLIREHSGKLDPSVMYSTNNYHVLRAGLIATAQGLALEGVGSGTKRYFWVNAFIREFIATLYAQWKKHILLLVILMILIAIMCSILYLSVIL